MKKLYGRSEPIHSSELILLSPSSSADAGEPTHNSGKHFVFPNTKEFPPKLKVLRYVFESPRARKVVDPLANEDRDAGNVVESDVLLEN